MNDPAQRRIFDLDGANALLPVLIPLLEEIRRDYVALEQTRSEFGQYATSLRSKGFLVEGHRVEAEIGELVSRLRAGISEIIDYGVELKNIERGLIDFPALRNGKIVYLCWQLGEGPIRYWHELDAGFAGRQPLNADETD